MAKYTVTIIDEETGKSNAFTGLDMVLFDGITAKKLPDGERSEVNASIAMCGGGEFLGPMCMNLPMHVGKFVSGIIHEIADQKEKGMGLEAVMCQGVRHELEKHEKNIIEKCSEKDIDKMIYEINERFKRMDVLMSMHKDK